jgi:hypothetical protein
MKNLVGDNDYDSNSDFEKLNEEQKGENDNESFFSINSEENEFKISNKKKSKSKSVIFKTFLMFSPKTNNKPFIKKKRKIRIFLARKKNRKDMSDNIFKKIKSHFFKSLRNTLINKLKKVKDDKKEKEKSFKFNKNFIQDVSLKTNSSYWDEELYNFANQKLVGNKDKIIAYLKNNNIGKMTLRSIYKEYLLSQEFENDLPDENESQNYINKYKNKANDFINYYTKNRKKNNNDNKNKNLYKEMEKREEYEHYFILNDNSDILLPEDYINDNNLNYESNSFTSEPNLNIFQ